MAQRSLFAIAMGAVLLGVSTSSVALAWAVDAPNGARVMQHGFAGVPTRTTHREPPEPTLASRAAPIEPSEPPPAPLEPGMIAFHGPRTGGRVAITFDDGPHPSLTPRVLEVLRTHDVHATFFLLGAQAEKYPEVAQRIALGGHDLANHSHSHRSFRSLFPSEIVRELDRTDAAIIAAAGVHPRFVRPPFGRFPESAVALIRDRGGDVVLWSVDAADWNDATPEAVAEAVVGAAEPGSIILLHDPAPVTVRALPEILAGLQRRGLQPVSVSELLDRPAYLAVDDAAATAR
ncbi:MAG TPA: polysaccharide deacetylase family protein [Nannocystaceae bacterium]|nr:polysaccharide deacetylase family protein [Nannocystaceae bacterium]